MKITTLLFLLITSAALSQDLSLGLSFDWSGYYDFTENEKYKIKYDYNSTSLNNINMGLFARMRKNKITYTLFGNFSISNLITPDNQKNSNKNWDIELNTKEYKTGVYSEQSTSMLYGSYNPYYYKSYTREYQANVYTASNNLGLTGRYDITENFGIGLGVILGFTKYVVSVMDVSRQYQSFSSAKYTYTDRIEVVKESYDFWEIKPSIPVSVNFSFENPYAPSEKILEVYLSANVGKDFTATAGIRFDLVKIK